MSERSLTDSQVNTIRRKQTFNTATDSSIAREFGISRKTAYNIKSGLRYADVPLPTIANLNRYTVYQGGVVVANKTKTFVNKTGGKYRLTTSNGGRVTLDNLSLMQLALKNA
jgi:hypothetical protein